MKKILYILIIVSLVLAVSSCKRSELIDPGWDDPAGFYILLEGSANPAVFFIDGNIHRSMVYVRVTDSKGNPLSGRTIFFRQLHDSTSNQQIEWGYFENNHGTIRKTTNTNGEVSVYFYSPTKFYSGHMYIHALLEVNGRALPGSSSHVGNIPQDYIAITMYQSGSAGAVTEK
ncbi:MAG: Ig-like domain-containing protein [Acidobacteria bacterium]|jgi:hypothetical protein|nr:Ig-like domain-containing protein [Acidobacteriota bacterium]